MNLDEKFTLQVVKSKTYASKHARLIDKNFLQASLNPTEKNIDSLVNSFRKYQNKDGGFGHGLEPDIQMPQSSVLATTVGLQYLSPFVSSKNKVIAKALSLLKNSYNDKRPGWPRGNPDVVLLRVDEDDVVETPFAH